MMAQRICLLDERESPMGAHGFDKLSCDKWRFPLPGALGRRPLQMLVQKVVRSLAVDLVRAVEPFNGAAVTDLEPGLIEVLHLGVFEADFFIDPHAVEVAPLDHKRAGS